MHGLFRHLHPLIISAQVTRVLSDGRISGADALAQQFGLSEVSALGDLPTEKTNEAGESELEQLVARVGS